MRRGTLTPHACQPWRVALNVPGGQRGGAARWQWHGPAIARAMGHILPPLRGLFAMDFPPIVLWPAPAPSSIIQRAVAGRGDSCDNFS